ncbi:hypothetical protein JCM11641_004443 [Rhodosporidiobolus odoratus]
MAQPTAVDILPRHLLASASTTSSSNPSPTGTPPATHSSSATTPSHLRSPSTSTNPLPSPSGNAAPLPPPASPSTSSSNRFGLNLGFIQRRPRGWSASAQRSPGGRGSPATSPNGELPPSPGGAAERSSGGYGFPGLRRSLSKRAANQGGENVRSRTRRSSSQPPVPNGLEAGPPSGGESRPGSSGLSAGTPARSSPQQASQPAFSSLTATTSLPSPPTGPSAGPSRSGTGDTNVPATHKLRLVPHLESSRSLHFDPIERDLAASSIVRVGRFTDRHGGASNASPGTPSDPARVAFKSKVVSRGHAEIWVDDGGKFFIRDTKSSSGTFLNHIRLSSPNTESRPYSLKDGDVLQLGVDYQGGTEEIYRCVKMRVELNRGWQRGANNFNTAALAQLRALGGGASAPMEGVPTSGTAMTAAPSVVPTVSSKLAATPSSASHAQSASLTDCCICLYPVTVCQALFIAPCSHVTHFKCIRPLVEQNFPGFCCPLCRTYANLEADVEIDLPEEAEPVAVDNEEPQASESALSLSGVSREPEMDAVEEVDEPASRAPSIRAPRPSPSRRSSVAALTTVLNEAARRAASRPASIAPSVREQGEEEESEATPAATAISGDAGDRTQLNTATSTTLSPPPPIPHVAAEMPTSSSSSNPASPTPISVSSTASHLSPPSEDLYTSLADAATPRNNTFLTHLAESGAGLPLALPNFSPISFHQHDLDKPIAAGPPASGLPGMGSLDAAMLVAGPSRESSGSTEDGGEGESAEGGAEGEGDDGATQESGSQPEEVEGIQGGVEAGTGGVKGKSKEQGGEVVAVVTEPLVSEGSTPEKSMKTEGQQQSQGELGVAAAAALLI